MTDHTLEQTIRDRLAEALVASEISLVDRSHQHRRHAAARAGGRHFDLRIVSERFRDLRALARHRLVYDALRDLMPMPLHALKIEALTPEQAAAPDSTNSSPTR